MRRTRVIAGVWVLLVLACAGLLVPMVQGTREAAAQSKCISHAKYMAFALHSCHVVHGSYSGTVILPAVPPERRLSWMVSLLPCAEQSAVYDRFDLRAPGDSDQNRAAADRRFSMFVCPTAGESRWNEKERFHESPTAVTHYVGLAGVGQDAADLPANHSRAGAFGHDRRATLDHRTFVDGIANTLLILETGHELGHWAFGGRATVRPLERETAPYIGPGRPFGGFHPRREFAPGPRGGIMVAAMADTSVRYIRGDIDPTVLEALATANGREALPADW